MDRILKTHFDRFRDLGTLPPELSTLNGEVRLFNNKILLDLWRNNRKGIRWADEAGNEIMGAVDNLLQKDDKLIVLDYKTRGYALKEDTHKHYQNQMDVYNFLLRKNGHSTEDYAYLLFYHPHEVEEDGDVVFNTDLIKLDISVKNAETLFKEALRVLNEDMPECSEECEFCGWAKNVVINPSL